MFPMKSWRLRSRSTLICRLIGRNDFQVDSVYFTRSVFHETSNIVSVAASLLHLSLVSPTIQRFLYLLQIVMLTNEDVSEDEASTYFHRLFAP